MIGLHLESKSRIFQQEWYDTNVHNSVLIRPLLNVPVNNDYLTEKVAGVFQRESLLILLFLSIYIQSRLDVDSFLSCIDHKVNLVL